MGKLETDTRLEGDNGQYRASLHEDWQIWFPNGGYMAAMLLRAVGRTSRFEQPVTMTSNFLKVPKLGPVDITVEVRRATRQAEALGFAMRQDGNLMIDGTAWFGEEVPGYAHADTPMPEVPHYTELKPTFEIEGAHPGDGFWNNFEQRPVLGNMHWQLDGPTEPVQRDWMRFEPEEPPALNAGRFVVLLDSYGWPAAARAHAGDGRYIAPTLSLTVDFHQPYGGEWLLSEATSPVAENGYMQVRSRLWAETGEPVASAQAMLMCRPRPGYDGPS